jgi:class 3 adenylate cyclase
VEKAIVATGAIVGRDDELGAVQRFLDDLGSGPSALVIDGEAGIGKTTVWLAAVRAAEERSLRVLKARPAEAEARLSYAALSDLVGDAFDDTRALLPRVQERALAAALLRSDEDGGSPGRTTATALQTVLTLLAADEQVLLAIDDVQWLDPASADALAFAVRRLPARLSLLLARRGLPGEELPLGLARALPHDRVVRLAPAGLSLAALHQLVRQRVGLPLSRPLLGQLAESTGGNPFFALEMTRAYANRTGDLELGEPLPVPRSVEELVAAHVDHLSDTARQVALVAAATSYPTTSLITDALTEADVSDAVVEAEESGVLVIERDRVRFAHPLLASVVYGSASHERRRQIHKRLALVVSDGEQRARHLALSATEADEAIAADLEAAAASAAKRGAQQAAAELFAASTRLTPEGRDDVLTRRMLGEASALLASGDVAGARSLAERAVADAPTAALRADAHEVMAEIVWVAGTFQATAEHLEAALAAAPADVSLAARVYPRLVYVHTAHRPAHALELADEAMQALDPDREPAALASIVISRMWAGLMLGEREAPELLVWWRELQEKAGPEAPQSVLPLIYFHSIDDFEAARARHEVEDEWYRLRGADDWRAERQAHRAYAEFRAGDWDLAERLVEDSCATIAQVEQPGPWTMVFRFRSIVDAGRGRVERARETLVPLIEEAQRGDRAHWEALLQSALAFVEFTAGDHAAVDRAVSRMDECIAVTGARDYLPDRSEPILVESLVSLGEVERARRTLERLEARGHRFPRLWIEATLPRTRALVLAAEGDVDGALAALDALDREAAARLPFELACSLLVEGRLRRRARQRRASADAFESALEIFERLGAPIWVARTRGELDRVGLRRAQKELTATELLVAELAAAGLTNREVAAEAFMSPKTVEANLARVYRKLGIGSRAELGARIGTVTAREEARARVDGRGLATILFTDLVGSTEKTRALGDAAWSALLDRHNDALRRELARFSGEEVDTAGDGLFAVFDGPARAIQCALAIRDAMRELELEVRSGVHTGEVERTADKPRGIAVVTSARIMALADAGEVLVSATTRDLVAGSGLEFEDRGEHELKGLDGARRIFAVAQT